MKTIKKLVEHLRRDLRERWTWYREQQRQPRVRHWWDAYNS